MKIALLLPGFLDSPDYLHLRTFDSRLRKLGYQTEKLDPANLWNGGNISDYSVTNYLSLVKDRVNHHLHEKPGDIILIGHSLGAMVAIIAGNRIPEVTRIVALCPPPDLRLLAAKWQGQKYKTSVRDLPDSPQKSRSFAVPDDFIKDGLQYSAVEEAGRINKPFMIFIAQKDNAVSPQQSELIVKNAPQSYVVRQPNIGHDFRRDLRQCELVWNQIEDFISRSAA